MTAVETMTFKITLTRQEQAFLFLYQKAGRRLLLCTRKLMHIVAHGNPRNYLTKNMGEKDNSVQDALRRPSISAPLRVGEGCKVGLNVHMLKHSF